MSVGRAGCTRLQFLGRPLSDYSDFLVGGDRERNVHSLTEHIKHELRWDALELGGIREDSPNYQPLQEAIPPGAKLTWWRAWNVAPYLRISASWPEYSDGLRKGLRSDTKRQTRRLQQEGELTFRQCGNLEEAVSLLDMFAVQKAQRYISTGARNILSSGRLLPFLKEVASRLWDRGEVQVSSLDLNGRPVAVHFGFVSQERYFYYMPSFDAAFSNYSPGRLLLMDLVRNSFDSGLREFDFMAGADPYKYDWTKDQRVLYELSSFRSTPKGLALLGLYHARRRAGSSSMVRRWVRRLRRQPGRAAPPSATGGTEEEGRAASLQR